MCAETRVSMCIEGGVPYLHIRTHIDIEAETRTNTVCMIRWPIDCSIANIRFEKSSERFLRGADRQDGKAS